MNVDTVRLNISLPRELVQAMDKFAGSRKRNFFIKEAIKKQVRQREKEELDKILEQGYKAVAKEDLAITKEFESSDFENWDEYFNQR